MPTTEQAHAYRLIQWAPFGIALGLIVSMMSDREQWLYVMAVIGVLVSIAVGRTSGNSEEFSLQRRLWKFAKGWVVVVALAAISLLHGKWQPMVFFALAGVIATVCFWVGCKSSK